MPWIYDYDETVTVDGTAHNKKFVFIGNSSGQAELTYEAPKHWIDVDPTKTTLTEDEFIIICNAGMQSQMTLGAKITIANQYCSTYEVIGINHDGTTNSVDIMANTQVQNMAFGSSQTYSSSSIRTWINGTYLSAFSSTIQSLAKTMSVVTSTGNTTDKVKLLSAKELNLTSYHPYMPSNEGNAYSVFTAGTYSSSNSSRWRADGSYGNSSKYWLRTPFTSRSDYVWLGSSNGYIVVPNDYPRIAGVLPVMRF